MKRALPRSNAIISCLFAFYFYHSNDAVAQTDICRQAAANVDDQTHKTYDSQINFYLKIAGALQAKGVDPRSFPQANPAGGIDVLDIPELIQALALQKENARQSIFQAYQQCEAGFIPYQNILNVGSFFLTAGISQIVPPAATHMDVSNILAGTPFGGHDAIVPKARSQVLDSLGIGGDVRKVIENPVCIFGC
ncbi:hypothetical protein [Acidisoma silvae]|uniref:Uncharacterized protein n=1 Tax=Acidisoma silvae TaxID=2802396 RepID=A0A964E1I7_9PROT|nr:hypothetical protein [Acidisoma silvae]MCB8878401.1 hypothetical protein [Acidisoma silvae]